MTKLLGLLCLVLCLFVVGFVCDREREEALDQWEALLNKEKEVLENEFEEQRSGFQEKDVRIARDNGDLKEFSSFEGSPKNFFFEEAEIQEERKVFEEVLNDIKDNKKDFSVLDEEEEERELRSSSSSKGKRQDDRDGPRLTRSQVLPMDGYIMNQKYEYLVTSLEFDEDIYLNEPFICAGNDYNCTVINCTACDWSDPDDVRTGCDDDHCCGPAQWQTLAQYGQRDQWCNDTQDLPSFTKLHFEEYSDKVSLEAGEWSYFRFFIGDDEWCKPVSITVHTDYGQTEIIVHNLMAFPSWDNLMAIDPVYRQTYTAGNIYRSNGALNYAQSVVDICPNVNPGYSKGTYSIAVHSLSDYTRFSIELRAGYDEYPMDPPENRINCSEVPRSELSGPTTLGSPDLYGGHVCLEEGVTTEISFPSTENSNFYEFVLPINPGCHEIQFAFNGFTGTGLPRAGRNSDVDLFCFQTSDSTDIFTAYLGRSRAYDDTWYVTGCFDEVYYMHCTAQSFSSGNGMFYWTTEATPRRYKMSELSAGQMAMVTGVAHAAGVAPDQYWSTLFNWGFNGVSHISQPTTDPLVFWPPIEPYIYNFTNDPAVVYQQAVQSEVKNNMLVVVDFTTINNNLVRDREELIANGMMLVNGFTNANGDPVVLANNGQRLSENRSITEWIQHQTFATLTVDWYFGNLCDSESYNRQVDLVNGLTEVALTATDLDTISAATYESEIYSVALARSACIMAAELPLDATLTNISRIEINYCVYEFESEDWLEDPCCNIRLLAYMCCDPQLISQEVYVYDDVDTDEVEYRCNTADCAESYFTDVSKSLNTEGNPLTGCSSGIQDPNYELAVRIEKELERFVRPCLVQCGFGTTYNGVKCENNNDCASIGYGCNPNTGICYMGTTEEAQDCYFDCFLADMSAPVEEYIRTTQMPRQDRDFPTDSPEFRAIVREAATINNCIDPNNPLDIVHSERWEADSITLCKRLIDTSLSVFSDIDVINSICPPRRCLGDKTCRWEDLTNCRQTPEECRAYSHEYILPLEGDCPIDEEDCNVGTLDDCNGTVCVVCDDDDCTEVGISITTETQCDTLVVCETSDGWRYDLTEDECNMHAGHCDLNCNYESCVSMAPVRFGWPDGQCAFLLDEATCRGFGLYWLSRQGAPPFCTPFFDYNTQAECDLVTVNFGIPTQFVTCDDLTLDECDADSYDWSPYYYLGCALERFSPCLTEDECVNSNYRCSDMDAGGEVEFIGSLFLVRIKYGFCYGSGVQGIDSDKEPWCYWPEGERNDNSACLYDFDDAPTEEACAALNTTGESDVWRRTGWVYPAQSEEECLANVYGRRGCILPDALALRPYMWLEEGACECVQGTLDDAFEWKSEGTWTSPRVLQTQWMTKETQPVPYRWETSLSLTTMEEWVQKAIEELFVVIFKSQVVCANNYLTSSLTTIVCDCFNEDEEGGDDCFENSERYTKVGLTLACHNERAILKGPPSITTFSTDSIKQRCTGVDLDIIQQSWFLFPPTDAGVSFQFAEKKQQGVVLNGNGATVGTIMGDGSRLTFVHPNWVNEFRTCLRIDGENDDPEKYPVRDFGSPTADFESIRPLGLNIQKEKIESSIYWCAEIDSDMLVDDDGKSVSFFPVYVREDAETYDEDPYDHQTTSLVYTLGACYCLDLALILIYLAVIGKNYAASNRAIPLVTWIAVLFGIVCIFRICFCFIYPDGGFEDNQLAEYVVFEIPTFLLFTAVILAIALFMRLSKKSTFDFKGADKKIWTAGLIACAVVWSLFIIVTVIYAEVILETDSTNVCPGRAEEDNSKQEEDARTLSIVYQSIVIFLTLCFALFFLRSAIKLFMMTKSGASNAKRFIFRIGSVIVVAFLLRCVLFLVLLAIDLTSDIYLFITLMLTEVVMMLLIALEFNQRFYNRLASTALSSVFSDSRATSGSATVSSTGRGSSGSRHLDQSGGTVMDD